MQELCQKYGVEIQSLPPFRPDGKGLVEKSFDLIQQRYKPLLRRKGVIEPDAQERWSTDYRSQSVLNLDEFTQIVIHCVLYLNSGRSLSDAKTPAQKWLDSDISLLDVPVEELYLLSLPREAAKLTRKGLRINGLLYVPTDIGFEARIGQKHRHNRSCVNPVCLRLPETETFPVKVGAQRVQDIGGQTVVKKKPKNVVAVMPGRLKPYFYAVLRGGTGPELVQQGVEAIQVIMVLSL